MRMLIVLFFCLICTFYCKQPNQKMNQTTFLIFSNDGTFYNLDPSLQQVEWYSSLTEKLIDFQLQSPQKSTQQSTYFIPTIDGHFVYIQRNKQHLIHREELENLLKMCFGKSTKDIAKNQQKQQYFLHQTFQYFFVDQLNGKLWPIEKFFQEKIVVKQNRHILIKISKKFLKQLNSQMKVKWSSISSTIDILSAFQFLQNPQTPFISEPITQSQNFQFRRISSSELRVENTKNNDFFEIGGSSPVLAVFAYKSAENKFYKYPVQYFDKPVLALDDKHNPKANNPISKILLDVFPHASQFKNSNDLHKTSQPSSQKSFSFQYCLNTFRTIQQLSSSTSSPQLISQNENINSKRTFHSSEQPLDYPLRLEPQYSSFQPQVSKQQPLIYVFIIGSLIVMGVLLYRIKVNKLLNQLEKMETINDKKFQEIQKKLGHFQEMQKMYQVNWDQLIGRKGRRKSSDQFFQQLETTINQTITEITQTTITQSTKTNNTQNTNQLDQSLTKISSKKKIKLNYEVQVYQHMVFQGRFLNKDALVYAVPIQAIDLIHVEHQLNDLLSCSHKNLIKLYYYTKNSQFLLIFCEKIQPLWNSVQQSGFFNKRKQLPDECLKSIQNLIQPLKSCQQQPRWSFKQKPHPKPHQSNPSNLIIKQIIDCMSYLDSKLQIFSLPLECIILNERQSQGEKSIQIRINAIPAILQVHKYQGDDQEDSAKARQCMNRKLRQDLVKSFYFILKNGEKVNIQKIHSMASNNTSDELFFVKDFYDFILNENYNTMNIEIQSLQDTSKQACLRKVGSNYQFLSHLPSHPFLWQSKRKMLFISDFSNYIQTYLDDSKIKKLQSYARDYQIIQTPWSKQLDRQFVKEIIMFRKYDFYSVKDLIRLIRNKVNHFHQIPKETRNSIGKTPQAFTQYMLGLYPKLLSFAFVYAKRKKWKLHVQIK